MLQFQKSDFSVVAPAFVIGTTLWMLIVLQAIRNPHQFLVPTLGIRTADSDIVRSMSGEILLMEATVSTRTRKRAHNFATSTRNVPSYDHISDEASTAAGFGEDAVTLVYNMSIWDQAWSVGLAISLVPDARVHARDAAHRQTLFSRSL